MFCQNCGKEMADTAVFCNYCGAKLYKEEPKAEDEQKVVEEPKVMGNSNVAQQPKPVEQPKEKKNYVLPIIFAVGGLFLIILIALPIIILSYKTKHVIEEVVEVVEETPAPTPKVTEEPIVEAIEVVEQPELTEQEEEIEVSVINRPFLVSMDAELNYNPELEPCVPEYSVEEDLSNITNLDYFYINDSQAKALVENGFFVMNQSGSSEFFEEYEMNRYLQKPNFVTVDSLMHTYHIYFSYLLQNTEKNYITDVLKDMSYNLYIQSMLQYNDLYGTDWEEATLRNIAFFAVACHLQGVDVDVPEAVQDVLSDELNKINEASGIDVCWVTGDYEDYSQYKPRGYYEGDEILENYFRTMMWYGRLNFNADNEELTKSALLMTLALEQGEKENWEKIYTVTSFFAGASDDLGYFEYMPTIEECYGEDVQVSQVAENEGSFNDFLALVSEMDPPKINSMPIEDGESNVIPGFRFMGQRFSIDATIMQNLVYQAVEANSDGENRMLPDTLDVMAALGSEEAYSILDEQGATDYSGYTENMQKLREQYNNAQPELWKASLYANWLDTLRPLLDPKKDGYPTFMKNSAWTRKSMETFAGSYAELKHDTVLYSKQMMAEMGGGDEYVDDRGYVEPQPLVYAKFENLATQTAEGLWDYGMISSADYDNLVLLSELASKLVTISEKELLDQTLTDEEYELIRSYGGNLEHFWYDAMKSKTGEEYISADEYPCPVITDIATDPNGQVLEIGNGKADTIYVVVPVDGTLRLATGSVYSFYQFPWDIGDRLTDSEWRIMMGAQLDENNEYHMAENFEHPEWMDNYRLDWEWNY